MSSEQQNKASLGFAWVFQDYIVYTRCSIHLKTIQKLGLLQNMVTGLLRFRIRHWVLYPVLLST